MLLRTITIQTHGTLGWWGGARRGIRRGCACLVVLPMRPLSCRPVSIERSRRRSKVDTALLAASLLLFCCPSVSFFCCGACVCGCLFSSSVPCCVYEKPTQSVELLLCSMLLPFSPFQSPGVLGCFIIFGCGLFALVCC